MQLRWSYPLLWVGVSLTWAAIAQEDPNMKTISLCAGQWYFPDLSGSQIRILALQLKAGQPYLDTDMQSRWFDYGGDTIIRSDRYIRLASDLPGRTGWVFSKVPLTATNWQVELEFKIHGKGSLHGDGMALWITKGRATKGPVFGSADNFEGLGVFFDTYKNNRPGVVFPYVMAMVGDGKTPYDKNADGREHELAGCSARGIRGATIPTRARLTYIQDKSLLLELQYKSEEEWTECFKTGPVAIPSVAYLGLSAETGELSDNFDIIGIETRNLYSASQPGDATTKPNLSTDKGREKGYSRKRSRQSRGWGWLFVKIVLIVAVCGGAYVGFTMYRNSKRHSRFD